jgi:hypothetical protein
MGMKTLYEFVMSHATKLLGFSQITVGVLAVADGIFTDKALKYILLASGLLTAWRGFFNSLQINKDSQ